MNRNKLQTGSAHIVVVIILIIAMVGSLGFIFYQNFITKNADKKAESSSGTSKSNSDTNDDSEITYKTFTDSKYNISFQYPGTWTLGEPEYNRSTDPYYNRTMDVFNENGETVASLAIGVSGLGGTCDEGYAYTVLDAEDSSIKAPNKVSFSFAVISDNDGNYFGHFGLTEKYTKVEESVACIATFYYLFDSSVGKDEWGNDIEISFGDGIIQTKKFSSIENAKQYMESDEYKEIKKMILSLSY